jgi:hypothetical protein
MTSPKKPACLLPPPPDDDFGARACSCLFELSAQKQPPSSRLPYNHLTLPITLQLPHFPPATVITSSFDSIPTRLYTPHLLCFCSCSWALVAFNRTTSRLDRINFLTPSNPPSHTAEMHRTYSMRTTRAPTASQLQVCRFMDCNQFAQSWPPPQAIANLLPPPQSPPPPPSSTKSGRFFGKGNLGMCIALAPFGDLVNPLDRK